MLEVLLESWDRQCHILDNLFEIIPDDLKAKKPSEDGMPIYEQFAHIHNTRRFWLSRTSPAHLEGYGRSYVQVGEEDWEPVQDLGELRELLRHSAKAVRDATEAAVLAGQTTFGGYDHPVLFLQHMLWHEGYHFALIVLAQRLAGAEPSEEWEDTNVWGLWRVED
ncbi:MAG TPA: DinB family protein [Fimbriimonadaceae bacterium]|nr:DinB family protein [Fimbriimonadaceae bacterium]